MWLHPECVFEKNELGASLADFQWSKCRLQCGQYEPKIPILYHRCSGSNNEMEVSCKKKNFHGQKTSKRIQQADILSDYISSDSEVEDNQSLLDNVFNYSPCSGLSALHFEFDGAKNASQDPLPQSRATVADQNTFPNDSSKSGATKSDTAFFNENAFSKHSALPSDDTEKISCKTYSSENLDSGLSQETLQKLGHFTGNLMEKEKMRLAEINISDLLEISREEWEKMVNNRLPNRLATKYYSDILLKKLQNLFSDYAPCVRNHYLRNQHKVVELQSSDDRYYEGNVNVYCAHSTCCKCEVVTLIKLYSRIDRVEANICISGKRSHDVECVRQRPVTGERRKNLVKTLENEQPLAVYRSLQTSLTENERVYGSHTYAPSQAVLRNIKYREKLSNRFSNDWVVNLKLMAEKYKKNNNPFIREYSPINPWVILFTDAQIHAYCDICRRDIIYFDATGSVLKNSSEGKQYQMYNFVIRNPYEGGPALPVATFISSCHNSIIISHFINEFLKAVTKKCGPKKNQS